MKTYQPKQQEVTRDWHLVDAKGRTVGRLATEIAKYLTGKQKPTYSTHVDMGDCVVVTNASKMKFTGQKLDQKIYYRHSNYPSGLKKTKLDKLMKENPEKVVELAVKRMLADNRLRDKRMRRLKVFGNDKHPYEDKFK